MNPIINIASAAREVAETLVDLLAADPMLIELEPETNSALAEFAGLDISRAREVLEYNPRAIRTGLEAYLASLPD